MRPLAALTAIFLHQCFRTDLSVRTSLFSRQIRSKPKTKSGSTNSRFKKVENRKLLSCFFFFFLSFLQYNAFFFYQLLQNDVDQELSNYLQSKDNFSEKDKEKTYRQTGFLQDWAQRYSPTSKVHWNIFFADPVFHKDE